MGGWVSRAGSTGIDHSANAVAVPYGTYVLLLTIAANQRRNFLEVQNQSTSQLQLVRDDGTGANQTSIFLSPAAASPGQGAGWSSDTFKGRIRVYGPSGALEVGAYED
jgi:hypothetical protein